MTTRATNGKRMTAAERRHQEQLDALEHATTALNTMATLSSRLSWGFGHQYAGKRDLYRELGYQRGIGFADYMQAYERTEIAKAVIDLPAKACWGMPPTLTESDTDETPLELEWARIERDYDPYKHFQRLDRLAALGRYAVLFVGLNDSGDPRQPLKQASELIFTSVFNEDNAKIVEEVTDAEDARFGLPLLYQLKLRNGAEIIAHHTRIIHVAEDCLDSEVEGAPRLRAIYNRLQNLEIVAGSSAELWWRNAVGALIFSAKEGMSFSPSSDDKKKLDDAIEAFVYGIEKMLRLQGVDVTQLESQTPDPSNHINAYIDMIAAGVRVPQRILMGSERGQLASTQDERNWAKYVEERRINHCEANIMRPFIDLLMGAGVLPAVQDEDQGYGITWPDLLSPSDKEKADRAKVVADAIASYLQGNGEIIVPVEVFLKDVLAFDEETVRKIQEIVDGSIDDRVENEEDFEPLVEPSVLPGSKTESVA